ncbi:GtrA family protein [Brevibacterium sp.]|uniref:GtrA family protein n=1 Tax=Brevibacterium sp. TaxID=1701 RepID=UPI002811DF39|nr:GtrA family protein [Brevibacterium sp.]
MGRSRSEIFRLAKFGTVGSIAFLVDLSVFNLLLFTTDIGPLIPKVVSVAAATTVSWLGSRHWTFRDGKTDRPLREALGFYLVNAIGLAIAGLCLVVSHYVLGWTSPLADNISANVVGVGLGNVFRYLMYRFVLFQVPAHRSAPRREVVDLTRADLERADLTRPGAGSAVLEASSTHDGR